MYNKNINQENLCGQKFNKLLVLEKLNPNNQTKYKCQCDCGNIVILSGSSLKRGNNKSCGCSQIQYGCNRPSWKGYEEIGQAFISRFEYCAKKRNLEFNVDIKYLWELYLKQNKKCPLSGTDLFFQISDVKRKNKNSYNLSLDRIDSSKNYNKDNLQWIYKPINSIKWHYTDQELIQTCNDIYDYQKFGVYKIVKTPLIKKYSHKPWFGEINKTIFNTIVRGAKDRNIDFNTTIEQMWDQFLKQNKQCKLSGVRLYFNNTLSHQTASLDRINSNKNYDIDNIQWIHKDINIMKGPLEQNYFLDLVSKIALYNQGN